MAYYIRGCQLKLTLHPWGDICSASWLCLINSFSCLFLKGVEVNMPSIQPRGSGQRATHHHAHNASQLNRKRLTRVVSISLPSSPLLPRQADIVSSQSCVKFPGGLPWNNQHAVMSQWHGALCEGLAAEGARCSCMALLRLAELLCIQLFHTCDSEHRRCPQGPP